MSTRRYSSTPQPPDGHVVINGHRRWGNGQLPNGARDEFVGTFPCRIVQVGGTTYACPRCHQMAPQWVTDTKIWEFLPYSWLRDHPEGGTLCVPCFVDLVGGRTLWRVVDPRRSEFSRRGSVIPDGHLRELREWYDDDGAPIVRPA